MGFPGKLPHTHLLLSLTPPARSSCALLLPSYWQAALCSSAGLHSRRVPLNNPKSQRGGGGGGGTKRRVTPALTTGAEGKFNGQKKNSMKSEGREDVAAVKDGRMQAGTGSHDQREIPERSRSGDCLEIHPAAPRNDIYV